MIRSVIPLTMRRDNLSLFEVLKKATVTTEKNIMIYLHNFEISYHNIEIKRVRFVLSEHNLVNAFTKIESQFSFDD